MSCDSFFSFDSTCSYISIDNPDVSLAARTQTHAEASESATVCEANNGESETGKDEERLAGNIHPPMCAPPPSNFSALSVQHEKI